jgi:hypothetical protein
MSKPKPERNWRDFSFRPHPTALVFNKRTTEADLKALAKDIDVNGLKTRIRTREVAGEAGIIYVIDGISRLDAMEKVLGWTIVDEKGNWQGALLGKVEHLVGRTHEQIAKEVISFNATRRHQSKQELVKDIDEAIKAGENLAATSEEGISRKPYKKMPRGKGRPKDEHKAKVVKEAAKHGISKSTVEKGLADKKAPDKGKAKGKAPKGSTRQPKAKAKTFEDQVWLWFAACLEYSPFVREQGHSPTEVIEALAKMFGMKVEGKKPKVKASHDITAASGHATDVIKD